MGAKPQPCYNRIRVINNPVIMRLQCMLTYGKETWAMSSARFVRGIYIYYKKLNSQLIMSLLASQKKLKNGGVSWLATARLCTVYAFWLR